MLKRVSRRSETMRAADAIVNYWVCCASVNQKSVAPGCFGAGPSTHHTADKSGVIAAWNTRHTPAITDEDVERAAAAMFRNLRQQNWKDAPANSRTQYLFQARAALTAYEKGRS